MKTILTSFFLFLAAISFGQTEWGCTDPSAPNYNPQAISDDGTCCYGGVWYWVSASEPCYFSFYNDLTGYLGAADYPSQTGVCIPDVCTSVNIHGTQGTGNYSWSISNAEGVIIAEGTTVDNFYDFAIIESSTGVSGCMDPQACNFNANATCFDYTTCDYTCYGCTNPGSINYNPNASIDDGSCCDADHYLTATFGGTNDIYAYCYLSAFDGSWGYYLTEGTSTCVPDGCYYLYTSSSDYVSEVVLTLTDYNGNVLFNGSASPYTSEVFILGDATPGCSDPYACNYDPSATCGTYNLCTYNCYGCTNPEAPNYNPEATIDNGSCCTETYTLVGNGQFEFYVTASNSSYIASGSYPSASEFCLPDGCFFLDLWSYSSSPFNWTLLDAAGNEVASGSQSYYYASQSISNNGTTGCLDPWACNYDSNADCSDYSLCTYDCYGCTDPQASNFDPEALINDYSCCYGTLYTVTLTAPAFWQAYSSSGATATTGHYPEDNTFCFDNGCLTFYASPDDYTQTNLSATISQNGEVVASGEMDPNYYTVFLEISSNAITGCTDGYACNYDPTANCYDYSLCDYSCYGCTNPAAPNFNPNATIDNGSCCYNDWYTISLSTDAYWSASALDNYYYASGSYPAQNGFCMNGSCFQFSAWSNDGSDVEYTIYDVSGNVVDTGTISYYDWGITVIINGATEGCGDPQACNYDASADCMNYYTCDYSCLGCTDPNAPNYDPNATIDNGTCCYNNWYTLNMSGQAYWYVSGPAGYYYYGGIYPEQNGFCLYEDCFNLQVYTLDGSQQDITVLDADGNVIYSGLSEFGYYNVISISSNDEIAGCTDQFSCNYNPEATCDDGSCYICYGCVDPSALNYDPQAWYDDGSCIYQMNPPLMGMSMITDEENDQFWVRVEVMETGNGAPYLLSTDYNDASMMISAQGVYMAGPFPCDASVEFTLNSVSANMIEYMNASMDGACAVAQSVIEVQNSFSLMPNPANDRVTVAGWETSASVTIRDISGRLVRQENLRNNIIETSMLTDGLYIVTLTEGTKTASMQLVVQH
jgi:hypothetical protein